MEMVLIVGNSWILSRLKEPSTWKGVAVLVGVMGWNLDPELLPQIGVTVAAVIGLIEVIRKEP